MTSSYGRLVHEGRERWARVEGGEAVLLDGAPWESAEPSASAESLGEEEASWNTSVRPSKIVAFARTFAAHAAEHGVPVPEQPLLFLKSPSSLLAAGGDVLLPPESERTECEGELALVIGRRVRRFPPDGDPADVVFGCLPADDVTARDVQRAEGQWARGKSFDTFCPVGPRVTPGIPPADARLTTHVGDEQAQGAPLGDMVFPLARLLAHASAAMTLEPGDLVLTGTPEGVRRLAPGDVVRVAIDGLMPLEHGVVAEP